MLEQILLALLGGIIGSLIVIGLRELFDYWLGG